MRIVSSFVLLLFFAGCASSGIRSPLKAIADPQARLTKDAGYAFIPEPDMRIEKRLLYDRATEYLRRAGFRMTSAEEAQFLIRIAITSQFVTTVDLDLTLRSRIAAHPDQGDSTFHFIVYRQGDVMQAQWKSVWEASIIADQREFRALEEDVILGVFSKLGETVDTRVAFRRKG